MLALVGAVAVWKQPRFRPLLPLQAAAVLMILVAGKWFDWWGGVTWGYRSIVDTTPFLALLMIPMVERLLSRRGTRALLGALLAWSAAVQLVGAYSYSLMGWSDLWREYDQPEQASLWHWQRPQIGYHVANFAAERARKKEVMTIYLNYPGPILNVNGRRDGP